MGEYDCPSGTLGREWADPTAACHVAGVPGCAEAPMLRQRCGAEEQDWQYPNLSHLSVPTLGNVFTCVSCGCFEVSLHTSFAKKAVVEAPRMVLLKVRILKFLAVGQALVVGSANKDTGF